jgi:hypothetical protein
MMLKAETAYGDDADSFSNTGSCSNSFTFKCAPSKVAARDDDVRLRGENLVSL